MSVTSAAHFITGIEQTQLYLFVLVCTLLAMDLTIHKLLVLTSSIYMYTTQKLIRIKLLLLSAEGYPVNLIIKILLQIHCTTFTL